MATSDLLKGSDKEKRLSHIKNLFLIAASDGVIEPNEIAFISQVAVRVGLTDEELQNVMNNPQKISFTPPSDFEDKALQLFDMIHLMMIDGNIHDNEIELCDYFATKLEFKSNVTSIIVNELISAINKGMDADEVISDLEKKYA